MIISRPQLEWKHGDGDQSILYTPLTTSKEFSKQKGGPSEDSINIPRSGPSMMYTSSIVATIGSLPRLFQGICISRLPEYTIKTEDYNLFSYGILCFLSTYHL